MNSVVALKRFLTPVLARIRRVILGATIESTNDAAPLQQMKVRTLGRALYDNVELFGQFGFTSRAPDGLDAIIAERNGKYIVIAVGDRKYRIRDTETGDTVVYDVRGQTIVLNKDGIKISDKNGNHIVMNSAGNTISDAFENSISTGADGVTINGVLITQSGAMTTPSTVTTGGLIKSGGDVKSSTGKTLDTHTHEVPAASAITPPPAPTPSTTPPVA